MIEIKMDGPGKNSLGTAMMTFLLESLRAAGGEPVLLTGAGDAFSAGLNLKEVATLERREDMLSFLRLLEECMSTLYLYPGPTVAAINGHAIAGGCVTAICCDHRVMTTGARARIGLNETALGVRFPPRILTIVRRRLPAHSEDRLLLGGDLVAPVEAVQLGLVDELADDVMAAARARLSTLAAHPRDAYRLTKGDLRGVLATDLVPDEAEERKLNEALSTWSSSAVRDKLLKVLSK
ncbi:MAG: enoyl-CoA hydratase/isomerase family protein [Polyangiaceae bacterium]|nr:enoyl-CoA hydratase/isomerase family protein [Polyangiaceae bacterium]